MVAPSCSPTSVGLPAEPCPSINTSGHKYGLVYPGLGWVIWRSEGIPARGPHLPRLLPRRGYAHLALNFSRPGAQVLLQYYLFVRLGMEGYRTVHQMSQKYRAHVVRMKSADGALRTRNEGR